MKTIHAIAAVAAVGAPLAATAADWHLVFGPRAGVTAYMDRESVRDRGAYKRVWLRFEYAYIVPPSADGWPAHRSSLELRRFNCADFTTGVEQSMVFERPGARGEPLRGLIIRFPPLVEPPRESVGEAITHTACQVLYPMFEEGP